MEKVIKETDEILCLLTIDEHKNLKLIWDNNFINSNLKFKRKILEVLK